MLNNLQPVASIFGAIFLFQEFLTVERLMGAAMVLGGILLMQWSDSRAKR
jgi:drug/metabolite transporter (DMT)-like permease